MKKLYSLVFLAFVYALSTMTAQTVPLWVSNRTAQFSDRQYVSALGNGNTAQEAKDDALSQMALYFNARISVERNTHFVMTEGKEKHRSIDSGVSVESEAELPQVLFTAPFKYEKTDEWFVCAYIERSTATDFCTAHLERCLFSVQSALDTLSEKNPSFADMQILSEEKRNLARAEMLVKNLIALSRQSQDAYTVKLKKLHADMDALLAKARSGATFHVIVKGDDSEMLSSIIKETLVSQGMTLSPHGRYCVLGNIAMTLSTNDVGVFMRPTVSLSVVDETSGNPVYSFARQYKKWGHKNADGARAKALAEVEKDIREYFCPVGEL